ncbi:BTB/POZ domain [Arabidopsis suecica]|uniref:BTB/POZ domain n=1 Tax=Arabidopsis suecica TaxID=45249 RepID=A0A8T1Y1E9_ARASU|nr:BTB/POZ domain [Arabidopsis suecica]
MATPTNKEHFSGGLAKVLAEKWQVDLMLKAKNSDEGSAISAHKLILASRSEVFKKMLELDEFKTSTTKHVETITLSEMKQEELEAFVEFLYSDGSMLSVNVKQHARSLYLAADKYEIPHLRDLCRAELISSLSLSNSLDILELAQIPFDKVLHDAAFSYIEKNISTIASSDDFKLFVVSNPNLAVLNGEFRDLTSFSLAARRVYTRNTAVNRRAYISVDNLSERTLRSRYGQSVLESMEFRRKNTFGDFSFSSPSVEESEVLFSNSSSRICSSQEQSSSPRSLIPHWQIFTVADLR